MISETAIVEWSQNAPWPTLDQIEQDLLLSQLMIALANDEFLGEELIFRGGTCLHKLILDKPLRYSEDLDYVRASDGPMAPIYRRIQEICGALGFKSDTKPGQIPKILARYTTGSGSKGKIKIEIQTSDRVYAHPLQKIHHEIKSSWFSDAGSINTFGNHDLYASKARALYQRSKGRDLFDLWLVLNQDDFDEGAFAESAGIYLAGIHSRDFEANLDAKLPNIAFTQDMDLLVTEFPKEYSTERAGELIKSKLLPLF